MFKQTQIENSPAPAIAFLSVALPSYLHDLAALLNPYGDPINRDRNLTRGRGYDAGAEEAVVMLDLAFVALGVALIGLMGLYAAGLRRL